VAIVETIDKALCMSLDGTERDRKIFMNLLKDLHNNYKVFTEANFIDGFSSVLKNIDEYVIDIPLAYKFMGGFLSFAITNDLIYSVNNLLTPFIESRVATKVAIEVLLAIYNEKGLETAQSWGERIDLNSLLTTEDRTGNQYETILNKTPNLRVILSL